MTPQAWQVLTWVLGGLLTVALFALKRMFEKADARDKENRDLRDANLTYRLAIIELKGTQTAVNNTLGAVQAVALRQEGTSP